MSGQDVGLLEEDQAAGAADAADVGSRSPRRAKVTLTTYLAAVAVTLASSYPFYAVVQDLRDLKPRSLIPCTDEPCQYMRIFSGAGIPNTWPFIVQVQNGVSRPVTFTGLRSGAAPVLHKHRPPRSLLLFAGNLCGGFLEQEFTNESDYHESFRVCLYGVCVDNRMHPVLPWQFWSKRPWQYWSKQPAAFNETMQDEYKQTLAQFLDTHKNAQLAVANLSKVEASFNRQPLVWRSLLWVPRTVTQGFLNSYVWLFRTVFQGSPGLAGVELTPSAQCGADTSFENMRDNCEATQHFDAFSESFVNPVQQGKATSLFLVCIAGWAGLKALHDILLLCGVQEQITMRIGFASLVCQGVAVGTGVLAVMNAAQVFVAEAGTACSCFYKLDDIRAMLSIVTPLLLAYAYFNKKKRMMQAVLSGDYLFYKTFDVPFRLVQRNPAWQGSDLLVPHAFGDAGAPGSVAAARLRPELGQMARAFCCHNLLFRIIRVFELLFLIIPVTFAMSTFLPRWMSVLSVRALGVAREDVLQTVLTYVLLHAPVVVFSGLCVQGAMGLAKLSKTNAFNFAAVYLPVGLLLTPPAKVWSSSSKISPAELLWCHPDWAFGSTGLVLIAFAALGKNLGIQQLQDLLIAIQEEADGDGGKELEMFVKAHGPMAEDMALNYMLQDILDRKADPPVSTESAAADVEVQRQGAPEQPQRATSASSEGAAADVAEQRQEAPEQP